MLSEQAQAVKAAMQTVVTDKRELEAIETEWRELLLMEEERLCELTDGELPIISDVFAERQALRKSLAVRQLRNWTRLQHVPMNATQRRIMRLRYIQGRTWSDIVSQLGKTKQYILREHNKVLERMATR